jgi:hypothetical protein
MNLQFLHAEDEEKKLEIPTGKPRDFCIIEWAGILEIRKSPDT